MKKTVAVFDIDGTILCGTSTERLFFRYLLGHGEINVASVYSFFAEFFKKLPNDVTMATKGNKAYLKGKEAARIQDIGRKYFHKVIVNLISGIARDMIDEHKKRGHEIILLSGAFDFFMQEYMNYLKVEKGYCTNLKIENGKYTGDIEGIFPYGQNKVEILKSENWNVDFENSFAYANDKTDIAFLKMFKNAVAVNPGRGLLKYARKNNLRILYC